MTRFKTYPISKDPTFRYRDSADTDIAATFRRVRRQMAEAQRVSRLPVLEVDEVQDAKAPRNVATLMFKRGSSR